MLILVTYDVSLLAPEGQKRLRKIAKTCLDYGIRVQNSVFECEIDMAQWVVFKNELLSVYHPEEDSLRFYFLGKHGRQKVEHYGAKPTSDVVRDTLLI
jgi:CRISPR-associated protein Cas2